MTTLHFHLQPQYNMHFIYISRHSFQLLSSESIALFLWILSSFDNDTNQTWSSFNKVNLHIPKYLKLFANVTFLRRVGTNRIVWGGNCGPANTPCQNEIAMLMRAPFIQWIVFVSTLLSTDVWIKTVPLKKGTCITCIQFWHKGR